MPMTRAIVVFVDGEVWDGQVEWKGQATQSEVESCVLRPWTQISCMVFPERGTPTQPLKACYQGNWFVPKGGTTRGWGRA